MDDGVLEGALGVGKRFGRGAEGHGAADVVAAAGAEGAGGAGLADLEGDAVAWLEGGWRDAAADGGDDAGGFVAEGEGLAHEDVAVAVVRVVVQVGAAEAGGFDGD